MLQPSRDDYQVIARAIVNVYLLLFLFQTSPPHVICMVIENPTERKIWGSEHPAWDTMRSPGSHWTTGVRLHL